MNDDHERKGTAFIPDEVSMNLMDAWWAWYQWYVNTLYEWKNIVRDLDYLFQNKKVDKHD